jgi:hypothetical protein
MEIVEWFIRPNQEQLRLCNSASNLRLCNSGAASYRYNCDHYTVKIALTITVYFSVSHYLL